MTDPTETARALLRDAENYLSALHGSVARHDNLAANLGCAGCELRDRLAAALRVPAVVSAAAPSTDHTTPSRRVGLRDEIAAAIWERQNPGRRYADCEHPWQADAEADADAVLAVLYREWPWLRAEAEDAAAPSTDQAAGLASFVLWLDASDGSVPTHDGVRWPDGTTTIHHRHFGITTTHHDPEAACRAAHGEQGRIVWPEPAPADRAAVLLEAAGALTAKAEAWYEEAVSDGDLGVGGGIEAAATELRRLAAEAPATTQADEAERRVYAWAETIDTADGGRTVHIPGVHHSNGGAEVSAIVVGQEDVPALAAMLTAVVEPAEAADTETVHGCPPDGSGLTPCCGRTPFELPLTDRISSEAPTTCPGAQS